MKAFLVKPKTIIVAETAHDFFRLLHKAAKMPEPELEDYIVGLARRAELTVGKPIRDGSPEELLEDLVKVGLVTEVQTPEKGKRHHETHKVVRLRDYVARLQEPRQDQPLQDGEGS